LRGGKPAFSTSACCRKHKIQSLCAAYRHVFIALPIAGHDVVPLALEALAEVRRNEAARARHTNLDLASRPERGADTPEVKLRG
jgi:hypothetical protein